MLSKASSSTFTLTTSTLPTPSRRKLIEPTLTDLSQSTQSTQSTLSQRRSSDSIIDITSMDIEDNSSSVEHEHSVERNTHISDHDYDTSPALAGETDSSHQENSKLLNKLVALDELSDGFWNIKNKGRSKRNDIAAHIRNAMSVTRRMHAFLRAFEKNSPAMPQMMEEIAEAEEKEAEEAAK
ncbi:hypothetical protein RCL_jg11840.t1 [Rhizophagus clarus]|uniref:Uncharacterized protein n=1 Tax=Rhizophagus clarus TaxID=94130 RepID=A0A8H3M8V3_9GLOM|nr:hypothetical protein RCL_jg11840.t1 [Rhizophagus clarus]